MCGIWGYSMAANLPPEKDQFTFRAILISHLMLAMDDRGGDSWGFILRQEEKLQIKKGMGRSFEKVDPQLLAGLPQIVAHTRRASSGSVTLTNAHPFVFEHIAGVHNGSVQNHKELNTQYHRTAVVDSEHIFMHLNEGKPLDEVFISGAIAWQDSRKPHVINLAKSQWGDLQLFGLGTRVPEGDTWGVIFASTDVILKPLLDGSGFPYIQYAVDAQKLYTVTDGVPDMAGPCSMVGYQTTTCTATPVSALCDKRSDEDKARGSFWSSRDAEGKRTCFRCSKKMYIGNLEWDPQIKEWFCYNCLTSDKAMLEVGG